MSCGVGVSPEDLTADEDYNNDLRCDYRFVENEKDS